MTKYILAKKTFLSRSLFKFFYKTGVFAYSLYMIFSSPFSAFSAEAPEGQQGFEQIVFNETPLRLQKEQQFINLQRKERIAKIRAYYARYDLPLQYEAEHFVDAADRYGIDWRLVAAIGFIESTGGKFACKTATYSAFGWGSCKINFDSHAENIDVVSMNLGGHNPNTAYAYKDKDLTGVLYSYNSVIPDYREKILKEMENISLM